jgi:RimJ/RimL family protein N-acetyltransferase
MTLLETSPVAAAAGGMPVLETARLVLRPPRLADAPTLAATINDRRIAEKLARVPHPYSLADAESFITQVNASGSDLAFLIMLPDDTLIGCCGIHHLRGAPEIGYWLGVPWWGKGYATEAGRALIDHAFTDLGHESLVSGALVSNPASRRVLEKCGFQWTGVMLLRIRSLATSSPCDRFRLDRGLWASLKSWGKVRRVA